jgi:hypothetical protein
MRNNLKPTPVFAQLKQNVNTPALSIREIPIARFDLPFRSLLLKSPEGTYIIEICEIFATTSKYEVSVNGRQFDSFERTEILMYSEEGVVTITLDQELLLPIANGEMSHDPWSFTIRAQARDGGQFEDRKPLFTLPQFASRVPSVEHFERLLDPSEGGELNILRIFSEVVVSCFWQQKGSFDVYRKADDASPFCAVRGAAGYLCEVK